MSSSGIRQAVLKALLELGNPQAGDFAKKVEALLNQMGYTGNLSTQANHSPETFTSTWPALKTGTRSESEFLKQALSVHMIFQYTSDDISSHSKITEFDNANVKSFLFFAVELADNSYPRSDYARLTREINKRFSMPVVVLFRNNKNMLTLSFVGRRATRAKGSRHGATVLDKVSLLREVDCKHPHRGHLDILAELSLSNRVAWMRKNKLQPNFDGLLAAWLSELDADTLNQRFYKELREWFNAAVNSVSFPSHGGTPIKTEWHVIRMISRILFIWFIKEKGLVADELFREQEIRPLLIAKNFQASNTYYPAVLQNLFFATLNTEISKRRFIGKSSADTNNPSLYRYADLIDNHNQLQAWFDKTPFVNGGLFDCLDDFDDPHDIGKNLDCFTDDLELRNHLDVPNTLFFGDNGLFNVLHRYKFTVEENTPMEHEVALDPELLGKVFENLLEYVHRGRTGTYYTPRHVVDYMVRESLIAYFRRKTDISERRLLSLLSANTDYDDLPRAERLNQGEIKQFVHATGELRLLDPAVGSGAFPMGALAQLTMALNRIDPKNDILKEREMRSARSFSVGENQQQAIEMVENAFSLENQYNDYARKLSLIRECLFGVDIEPAAVQICRLRFFISLSIEQKTNADKKKNFGIHPLPNLEPRLITANTLIPIRPPDLLRDAPEIRELETELMSVRRDAFEANTPEKKLDCVIRDKKKRAELTDHLSSLKITDGDAHRIAGWDMYDQTKAAPWFDAKWMFGVRNGFDIVIGNPPYAQLKTKDENGCSPADLYQHSGYKTFVRSGDIYQLFYEKGINLCSPNQGLLAYITSNTWLRGNYAKKTRELFSNSHTPLRLLDVGTNIFDANVDCNILMVQNGKPQKPPLLAVDVSEDWDDRFPPSSRDWSEINPKGKEQWIIVSKDEKNIRAKIKELGKPLSEWNVQMFSGLSTGFNQAFIIDKNKYKEFVDADSNSAVIIKRILRGKNIERYHTEWAGEYIINSHNGGKGSDYIDVNAYPEVKKHLDQYFCSLVNRHDQGKTPYNLRSCAYLPEFAKEKLIWIELVDEGRFAYVKEDIYCISAFMMTGDCIKYLCAFLNSKLANWEFKHIATSSGVGTLRWKKTYLNMLHVPNLTKSEQDPFAALVETIIEAKENKEDIAEIEAEIDKLVYQLYELTSKEISIIERNGVGNI